ncbi:MAG: NAD(P)-dependent oxidoreductase [Candidatus Dormibacteraeota bacterium]|nr:NAD(P)-dependent oxidoreductase [Candidatus Dormibacteraeota bacterium]
MKVLLVGGSGRVGTFITPYLRREHELRVLDLVPPRHEGIEFVPGSLGDPEVAARALDGVDTFITLMMKGPQGGSVTDQTVELINSNYETNTRALHVFLWVAQQLGVKRGVYTSTMSVHYRERPWYGAEDDVPLDTPSVYGLTKGFGELICRYFARWFDMNLVALRITGPREREAWLEERRAPKTRLFVSDEEDLANAYLAALRFVQRGHGHFEAFFIAGDESEREHNLSKARMLLGWEPRTHLAVAADLAAKSR